MGLEEGVKFCRNCGLPMRQTDEVLSRFNIPREARIVSAHRTPEWMAEYASSAIDRGLEVIVAGAGGAAHLPGMVAAKMQGYAYVGEKRVAEAAVSCQLIDSSRGRASSDSAGSNE